MEKEHDESGSAKKGGSEKSVQFGQPIPPSMAAQRPPQQPSVQPPAQPPVQPSPQPSKNQYVMTEEVKNGINVRAKATSESQLMYMLAKVDATHPVITITKMSSDNKWGFMDTGDPKTSGWLFMEYLRLL